MMKLWKKSIITKTPADGTAVAAPSGNGLFVTLRELTLLQNQARNIDLAHFVKVKTALGGECLAAMRGRGIDFAEVRHYQAGDEIRHIDWRVTARTGKTHTKLFQEERERPVLIVVDYSASMFFGSRVAFKSVIAAKLAAIFAFAAKQHGDRVGGLVFSGHACHEVRPQYGLRGVLDLFKQLIHCVEPAVAQPTPGAFANSLLRLRRLVKPGSLIIVISDFSDLTEDSIAHLAQLKQHNDVVAHFIYDPLEKDPPLPARYTITDSLDQQYLTVDTRLTATQTAYRDTFANSLKAIQNNLKKWQIPLFHWRTDMSMTQQLKQFRSTEHQERK